MGVGGGERGRGAWMLRGACSRGQEVLEPSVGLGAASTALPGGPQMVRAAGPAKQPAPSRSFDPQGQPCACRGPPGPSPP